MLIGVTNIASMFTKISKIGFIVILTIALIFALPDIVWAVWAATDDMESYSVGALDAVGEGGSGWSAGVAWDDTGVDIWQVVTLLAIEGSISVNNTDDASSVNAFRDLPATDSAVLSMQIKAVGNSGYVRLDDGATQKGLISIGQNTSGDIEIRHGAAYVKIDSYTASVAFTLTIDYGTGGGVCTATQWRAKTSITDTYTACGDLLNSGGNITRLLYEYAAAVARELWFDDIKCVSSCAAGGAASRQSIPIWTRFEL